MVVQPELSQTQKEALMKAFEDVMGSGSFEITNLTTASGSFDYVVEFRQTQTRRIRNGNCKIKWYDNQQDWEIGDKTLGAWLS